MDNAKKNKNCQYPTQSESFLALLADQAFLASIRAAPEGAKMAMMAFCPELWGPIFREARRLGGKSVAKQDALRSGVGNTRTKPHFLRLV